MGDDNAGAVQMIQRVGDLLLGLVVQGGGGLVQQQDLRLRCNGPGDHDPLLLASGDAALEHISFTAFPGQTVGIIGGTGSGKTTLVNLIPRFYDHTEGDILFGDTPIQSLTLSSLRAAVGVVPQHATLFQGTIRSNLLWGNPDASDQDLWEALEIAQGAEIVRGKPMGLDEPVQQGGRNFSGGQRQRLALARALLANSPVYVFDEATSNIDVESEGHIMSAVRRLARYKAVVVISHRLANVVDAREINVLDRGWLVGYGTHDELLSFNSHYKKLTEMQKV